MKRVARIRPILMTAIATIGALIPLLFGQDSSILISKGMAATRDGWSCVINYSDTHRRASHLRNTIHA